MVASEDRLKIERKGEFGKDQKMDKPTTRRKKRTTAGERPITVDVLLKSVNPLDFVLSSTGIDITVQSINGKNVQVLNFDNNRGGIYSAGYRITFNLIDATNSNYGFFFTDPNSPDDAIWVQKIDGGDYCPTGPSKWGPFKPVAPVSRNCLVVSNPNGKLQYFGFALCLSRPGEAAPSLILDPVGNNENGSSGRS
jgi:hypothetical protein